MTCPRCGKDDCEGTHMVRETGIVNAYGHKPPDYRALIRERLEKAIDDADRAWDDQGDLSMSEVEADAAMAVIEPLIAAMDNYEKRCCEWARDIVLAALRRAAGLEDEK